MQVVALTESISIFLLCFVLMPSWLFLLVEATSMRFSPEKFTYYAVESSLKRGREAVGHRLLVCLFVDFMFGLLVIATQKRDVVNPVSEH